MSKGITADEFIERAEAGFPKQPGAPSRPHPKPQTPLPERPVFDFLKLKLFLLAAWFFVCIAIFAANPGPGMAGGCFALFLAPVWGMITKRRLDPVGYIVKSLRGQR